MITHKRAPKCRRARSCRTADKTEIQVLPSLCNTAFVAISGSHPVFSELFGLNVTPRRDSRQSPPLNYHFSIQQVGALRSTSPALEKHGLRQRSYSPIRHPRFAIGLNRFEVATLAATGFPYLHNQLLQHAQLSYLANMAQQAKTDPNLVTTFRFCTAFPV